METYAELCAKEMERFNELPIVWGFSKKQIIDNAKKMGIDPTKLCPMGGGGYMLKKDQSLLDAVLKANREDREEFLSNMDNLEAAFLFELGNHEYCITYNDMEAWEAIGLDPKESTPEQRKAFVDARYTYLCQEH